MGQIKINKMCKCIIIAIFIIIIIILTINYHDDRYHFSRLEAIELESYHDVIRDVSVCGMLKTTLAFNQRSSRNRRRELIIIITRTTCSITYYCCYIH